MLVNLVAINDPDVIKKLLLELVISAQAVAHQLHGKLILGMMCISNLRFLLQSFLVGIQYQTQFIIMTSCNIHILQSSVFVCLECFLC